MGIRVLVADAQPLLTESLAVALEREDDLLPIPVLTPFKRYVLEAVQEHQPDVSLVDYWMSGIDGPSHCDDVLAALEGRKVILLSWFYANRPWFDAPGDIERALHAGAVGFVPKNCNVETLVEAIRDAHSGKCPVLADDLEDLMRMMKRRRAQTDEQWQRLASLTRREVEILELLALGTSVPEATSALGISPATLRTHIQRILHKTQTHSQVAAIGAARRYGVIKV